jgi:cytochrome c oxidase cbb3-type subunit 1
MYSASLVNTHFWLATIGTVVYITAMWVSGIMQGMMWRMYDDNGILLYTFAESVAEMHPYYAMRAIGGMIYWLGGAIMLFNVVMTIRQASAQRSPATAAA